MNKGNKKGILFQGPGSADSPVRPVLIDTSVWTLSLKKESSPAAKGAVDP